MGPLTTILGLPISGPMGALTWIARQIANAATQELLDPTRIETALLLLERQLEDGLIDEAAFEAEEERLLDELAEISALRAAGAAEAAETDDAGEASEPEAEPARTPAVTSAADDPETADPSADSPVEGSLPAVPDAIGTQGDRPTDPVAQEAESWTLV
jgi:hypothetical protein